MTRDEFLRAVRSDNIRSDAFDLDGHGDECYVLAEREGRLDVFYSERGLEARVRHFSTEPAALAYLLEALRADQSTNR